MTTQVKLLRNLSLIVAAALVITLAPPVSVIGEEVITLTTIMPGQDTLRVRRGVVGVEWRRTGTLTDAQIGNDNLLIKGNVGIGTTAPGTRLDIKNSYDNESIIRLGALNIGGQLGSAASWTRWYLGYNMFWDGDYSSGNWLSLSDRYRSLFINDNERLRFIVGMPIGETTWDHASLQAYTKFLVDLHGNGYFAGNVGIGTTSPATKLEVQDGLIKATGGLIIETGTSDPVSPETGQIWLRTDIP